MKPILSLRSIIVKFPEQMISKSTSNKLFYLLLVIGIIKGFGFYLIPVLLNEIDNVFDSKVLSIITFWYLFNFLVFFQALTF
jgi:hypothetical protein